MGKKKISLDDRIEDLKAQQEEARYKFIKLQGAIDILEQLKGEENEKTDKRSN